MINVFRKIRKGLLSTGQKAKYLRYAVGEIALVVIGILIALQLNLVKERWDERDQEVITLKQLREEFNSNLTQLDQKISMRTAMTNAAYQLLAFCDDSTKIVADSIDVYLARTTVSPTFDPITSDLISSGRLYLISDLELRRRLSRWTSELVQVTEEEQSWIVINRNHYVPYLRSVYPTRNINQRKWSGLDVVKTLLLDKNSKTVVQIGKSKVEPDLQLFFSEPMLENLLSSVLSSAVFANEQSVALRKSIVEILDLIDRDLKEME